jgi:predicted nucleic acid-binding protein
MPAVSNTTPLIYLGKINKLYFLKELYNKIYLAPEVWDDIIQPIILAKEMPEDLPLILNAKEEGWLEVISLRNPKSLEFRDELISRGFGKGEANSMALAKEMNLLFLANDKEAIETAKKEGIEVKWFTEILHDALKEKLILDYREYVKILDGCTARGLYISKKERDKALTKTKKISQS